MASSPQELAGASPDASVRPERRVFVIAGEASGDQHASNLVKAVLKRDPSIRFEGFGGPKMEAEGVRLRQNIVENLAIIGLAGILRNFPALKRLFLEIDFVLDNDPPDAMLLVDYPGFNLRVARKAKARGVPVIYYICPQTWAWHESRAKEFPLIIDKMLTIFPFEERIFREYGADATFVGHPLLDVMRITMTKEEVCRHFGLDPARPILTLAPGSRMREIKSLLPVMLEGAERIVDEIPDVQFVLPLAPTIPRSTAEAIIGQYAVDVLIAEAYRYNLRAAADYAWVASGTATLETAFLGVPMVIVYKTSWLTWMIAKRLVNLPYIGLANVVAGERIVPELLQDEATGQNLADRTMQALSNPEQLEKTRYMLRRLRRKVEYPGNESANHPPLLASERAARE